MALPVARHSHDPGALERHQPGAVAAVDLPGASLLCDGHQAVLGMAEMAAEPEERVLRHATWARPTVRPRC